MLEQRRSYTETIECSTFSLRATRKGSQLVGLEVDVRHPNLPGMRRTFELSEYLRHGLLKAPATVQQLLSADALESTRLEALRDLTQAIATPELRRKGIASRDAIRVASTPPEAASCEHFQIEKRLDTNWSDLLHGRTRQVISIVRGGVPLVDFSVSMCDRGEVAVALIHVLPLELRWPILNRDGSAVDRISVWQAVDEYIATLQRSQHYPWPQALEELGAMQDLRSGVIDDRDDDSVSCVMQVALAVLDEHRYATDPSFSIVEPSRAPFGIEGFARALPDGRVLWSAGPDVGEEAGALEFALGGFSTYGAPYKVSASVPHAEGDRLWRAVREIRFSRSWQELERGIMLLAKLPGVRFEVTQVTQLEVFPREVCSLVDRLHRPNRADGIRVGLNPSALGGDVATTAWLVSGLVRGFAPIHGYVDGPSLSSSWRYEGFLDEELHGQLVFLNHLGGEIIVTPRPPPAPRSSEESDVDLDRLLRDPSEGPDKQLRNRGEQLERLFTIMRDSPERFAREVSVLEGFEVRSEHLPRHENINVYAMIDRLAGLWHRSFAHRRKLGSGAEGMPEFRARELNDGRWSIARECCVEGHTSYHTMVVGTLGVEAVYLSVGQRGWLGKLQGTEIAPSAGRKAFDDWELQAIFPLMVSRGSSIDLKDIYRIITNSIGKVSVRSGVSMRDFDPERNRKDYLSIAGLWLRGLFS